LTQNVCHYIVLVTCTRPASITWRQCTASYTYTALVAVLLLQALQDANWDPQSAADQAATGVTIGAGMSCTSEISDAGALIAAGKLRRISPYFVPRILINMAAGAVSITHGLRGPNHAVSTACATGVHCIGDGFRMVQRGDADLMLAGATEACIDAISLGGFCRLKALSTGFNDEPEKASRPFDAARDGFVMGEGAAVLLLEELEHARARGARMYAEVRTVAGVWCSVCEVHYSCWAAVLLLEEL
jgi:3-oxoacyl-[acyl-carrier-protein] synthase II